MLTDAGRHTNMESDTKDGTEMDEYLRDHIPSIAVKSATIEPNSIRDAQRNENVLAGINEKREFHCSKPGCTKSFKRNPDLKRHDKFVHLNVRDFQCEKCPKKFNKKSNLRVHMKMHSDERPLACDTCDHRFKHKHALDAHMKRHAAETSFHCDRCVKWFRSQSRLQIHKREEHSKTSI